LYEFGNVSHFLSGVILNIDTYVNMFTFVQLGYQIGIFLYPKF